MKKYVILFMVVILTTSASAAKLQPLSIILDWFVNPTHGPIIIAQEKGFFKSAGLKVKIITPADPNDTNKLVAAGKADIGIGSDPQFLILTNAGLPLLRIGTLIDAPLDALTVSKKSGVEKLVQIKGKTIGYPVGAIDKFRLQVMLHHVGLSLKDVHLVDVHYNLVQALLSGKVDAIDGAMRDYEVPQIKLQNFPVITFYPEDYGMPPYAELNYIINRKEQHDPRIRKFFRAIKAATLYIKQHPKASWQILLSAHPELKTKLNRISWQMTYPLFPNNPGYTNKDNFMRLVRLMHQYKWLKEVHSYNYYVVQK